MVGSAARMRASLPTSPSRIGTFKSSRISTRWFARSKPDIFVTFTANSSRGLRPRQGRVEHAVGEAPLVVIPREHLHQRAVDDLRQRGIEDRRVRIMVEIARYQRRLVVRQ